MFLIPLSDAPSGIRREFDPTHTTVLRRRFRHTADFNLRRLRGQLRQAVVEFNILGLHGGAVNPFRGSADSLQQFSSWLETAAQASLDARWWCDPFLQQAVASGVKQASKELPHGNFLAPPPTSFASLHQLARSELRGIIAALVQKATRAAHTVTTGRSTPSRAFTAVAQPLDTDIRNRLFAFASTMTVKAHNKAKLESYRVNGIDLVGVNPELSRHQHDALTRDDDDDELVGWRTAGDDLVCEACEDAAEDSPYDLDEAESLIPLHPWCRCSVYPWFDRRFRHDALLDEEVGHEFRGNQYVPGISGGGEPGSQTTHAALNPEVVNVGGDNWNKETALRLETEYEKAKPEVQKLADSIVASGTSAATSVGHEWDDVPSNLKDQIADHWKEVHFEAENDYHIQQWHENGDALNDAKDDLVKEYNLDRDIDHEVHSNLDSLDWFNDAIESVREQREQDGEAAIPYSNWQLWRATVIDSPYDGHKDDPVSFVNSRLNEPNDAPPPGQMTLPGITAPVFYGHLTKDMRDQLKEAVTAAFEEKASDMESKMKAPDFSEMTNESLDDQWHSMSDADKLDFGKEAELIPENKDDAKLVYPEHFDPLDNGLDSEDYAQTGALARALSVERAADLMVQRGVATSRESALEVAKGIDREMWADWKSSSTSPYGQVMQVAVAKELAGHLRKDSVNETAVNSDANDFQGGMDAVRAYIRAKWETTQFLLDKSGNNTVQLYRAINVPSSELSYNQEVTGDIRTFYRLPNFKLLRNGAASTSTSRSVSNQWDGSTGRVVLRMEVPRTTVLAVPCYGQNNYHEHEVVIAGAAMKGWDAWENAAPDFEEVPMGASKANA